tara:strand:- start:4428 stop:4913 length:486 start_codon:yes stop_codon:yes gene_type:complete
MRQFKLSCCGAIMSKVPYECHSCGETSFFAEELDKEEQVYVMGSFSGDKKKETRPWGSFENLLDEEGYKVKKIVVNRDQRLSLQLHKYRSEYWHILSGVGEMQVGDYTWTVAAGSHVPIEKFEVHRIANEGDTPLVILELQTGDCQEDDIIRIEDDYGRIE